MHKTILNTTAEVKYRFLLLLSVLPDGEYTQQWLSAMDFISIYGRTFDSSRRNLHGSSWMRFTEYANRIWNTRDALHDLVMEGWVSARATSSGYEYRITEEGARAALNFLTSYAVLYRDNVVQCFEQFGHLSGNDLDAMIREKALLPLGENQND